MKKIVDQITIALNQGLPGWDAQSKMINFDRPKAADVHLHDPETRKSAVLSLLYPKDDALHTVLMLRNTYNGHHSGQISFPGGKQELEDESLWHTALREAEEEVGLPQQDVQLLGALTHVYIPPSRFMVHPYLAYTDKAPKFVADPTEVKKIIEVPLSLLMEEDIIQTKSMKIASLGLPLNVKYYDVYGETVWGATAMMISELIDLLKMTDLLQNGIR